jgi:hypothetical protein
VTYKEQAQEWHQQWFSERKLRLEADARLAELERENEALRKDAERYRWLRSRDLDTIDKGGVFAGMTPRNIVLNEEHLDTAIDAALKEQSKC